MSLRSAIVIAVALVGCQSGSDAAPKAGDPSSPPASAGLTCRPVVDITVAYPGASPAEVEQEVVMAIEEAAASVPGVFGIHSTAAEGLAHVAVTVADLAPALPALHEVVNAVTSFPQDAERPVVTGRVVTPRVAVVLAESPATAEVLHGLHPPTVARVDRVGARSSELVVSLDPRHLLARGLSAAKVVSALQTSMLDALAVDPDALGKTVVSEGDGQTVRLRDLASIQRKRVGPRMGRGQTEVEAAAMWWAKPDAKGFGSIDPAAHPGVSVLATAKLLACPDPLGRRPPAFDAGLIYARVRGLGVPKVPGRFEAPSAAAFWIEDGPPITGGPSEVGLQLLQPSNPKNPGAGVDAVHKALAQRPGIQTLVANPTDERVDLRIEHRELSILANAADRLSEVMGTTAQVWGLPRHGPHLEFELIRDRAITAGELARQVRLSTVGVEVVGLPLALGETFEPVRVVVGSEREVIEPNRVMVTLLDGQVVPLSTVARVRLEAGPAQIERRDKQRGFELTVTGAAGLRKRIEAEVLDAVVREFPGLSITLL